MEQLCYIRLTIIALSYHIELKKKYVFNNLIKNRALPAGLLIINFFRERVLHFVLATQLNNHVHTHFGLSANGKAAMQKQRSEKEIKAGKEKRPQNAVELQSH